MLHQNHPDQHVVELYHHENLQVKQIKMKKKKIMKNKVHSMNNNNNNINPIVIVFNPDLDVKYEFFFLLDQINDEESDFSSSMNKRALKLCEPQRKAITVLITTGE